MGKRRLEFIEDSSSKFWEIELTGTSHVVCFGRIGTVGQTRTKNFPTLDAASLDAAALVKEKLAKGYRDAGETGAVVISKPLGATPEPGPATRYTLTLPSNPASKVVLVLAEARLVTNEVAQDFPSTEAAREHLERVMGLRKKDGYILNATEQVSRQDAELAAEANEEVEVKFSEGYWSATFRGEKGVPEDVCARLLRRVQRDAPRRVDLVCDFAIPGANWANAIKGQLLPSVRSFIFDTYFQTQTRQGRNSIGDLAPTLTALPSLERAFATGKLALKACHHPTLAEVYFLGDPLAESFLRGLGACEFPALRRLVLSLASDAGPGPQTAIASLRSLRAPELREVHVDSLDDVAVTLEKLLKKGIPASWRVLGLSASVDDEDRLLDVLRANASRLAELEVLALPLGDEVSSDGDAAVRALLPNLRDTEEFRDLRLPAVYQSW